MKLKFLMLIFSFLILTACGVTKPVATTHTERIEQHVMPIPVAADTIEIEYRLQSTDNRCTAPKTVFLSQGDEGLPGGGMSTVDRRLLTVDNIKSTRGVNISRHETDTTSTLRITLRPDTVFVPYTHHIRSDTIVIPDRVCQQKLNRSNMINIFLILILIMIIIIFLKNRMTRK